MKRKILTLIVTAMVLVTMCFSTAIEIFADDVAGTEEAAPTPTPEKEDVDLSDVTISNLKMSRTSKTVTTITWDRVEGATKYKISYYKNDYKFCPHADVIAASEDATQRYAIRHLAGAKGTYKKNTTGIYNFKVQAINDKSVSKTATMTWKKSATIPVVGTKLVTKGIRGKAGKKLSGYTIAQGATSDGKYAYVLYEKRNGDVVGRSALIKVVKIDLATGKIVKVSPSGQKLGHGNDVCYNGKYLVVTGAKSRDPKVSFVSTSSLKKVGSKTVSLGKHKGRFFRNVAFNMIGYDASKKQYIVRSVHGKKYGYILNSSFKAIKRVKISASLPTLYPAGAIMNKDYIVGSYGHRQDNKNYIAVFNKNSKRLAKYRVDCGNEIESIFIAGDKMYGTSYIRGKGGKESNLFEIDL